MKICIVSFSGRSGGNCGRIAEIIRQKEETRGETVVFDFSAFEITPCGHCGYACFRENENCPYSGDTEFTLCETIAGSDLAYFIVPNYFDFPCANFFIFNERGQGCFRHRGDLLNQYRAVQKKFVVVSSTHSEHFAAAFRSHIPDGAAPDILFLSAKQFGKISSHGNLTDSEKAREGIFNFVDKS